MVWLPYTTTGYAAGAIVLDNNVTLRGENRVLVKRTGTASTVFINAVAKSNVVIENLTIDPNGLCTVAAVRASTGTSGMTLRNCKLIGGITRRTLTFRSLTSNVVTLTTATAHGLTAGNTIQVAGVAGTTSTDGALNGTFTVASAPTTTTLTYALTHANLASAASTGSVLTNVTAVGVHGFDTQVTSDLTVEDCWFDGWANNIRINNGPQRVTIQRNLFTNWQERCIYVLGTSSQSVHDLNIERNFARDMLAITANVRQPFTVQGDDAAFHGRVKFNFNTVIGPGTAFNDPVNPGTADQLSLHRCEDFEAIGNISIGGGDVGFTIAQQCHRGVVVGNVLIGANSNGIAVGSATSSYVRQIAFTGNTIMNNGKDLLGDRPNNRHGIWMRNASDMVTAGNVLGDDQGVKTQSHGIGLVNVTNIICGIDVDAGNATAMYDTSTGTRTNCTKPAAGVAL